jgi:hypothetical protein
LINAEININQLLRQRYIPNSRFAIEILLNFKR